MEWERGYYYLAMSHVGDLLPSQYRSERHSEMSQTAETNYVTVQPKLRYAPTSAVGLKEHPLVCHDLPSDTENNDGV